MSEIEAYQAVMAARATATDAFGKAADSGSPRAWAAAWSAQAEIVRTTGQWMRVRVAR